LLQSHEQAGDFLKGHSSPPGTVATLAESVMEKPGTLIGPYKVLEQIGVGGMGVVFLAEQQQPVRRQVALKVVKPGLDSRQVIGRFEAERQALALMDHPHIARVLDAGATEAGRPYFVMELVHGIPITRYCDEHRLKPRARLELFLPVCQAVQHAHQKGIIHRDLKPSNVLITLYDVQPVPKVIDFGVAKATGPRLTEQTQFTEFGAVVGTPEYMSPEQAEPNQLDIDTRSDIYSLGVLLYELLTGTTPLERKRLKGAALLEVLRLIREEEPPRPSARLSTLEELPTVAANRGLEPQKLSVQVRGELDLVVMKCLEKDRNRRYETANALAQDLQRYLRDEPVQACPPSAAYRFRKFATRNKGRLAAAAGVLLVLTAIAANFGWALGDRAARQEQAALEEVARRAAVAQQVRDLLSTARALLVEDKLGAARQKLGAARARLDADRPMLTELAAELDALEAELDRFQQFLALIDQAYEGDSVHSIEMALAGRGASNKPRALRRVAHPQRPRGEVVPFLLEALGRYQILTRADWTSALERSPLGPHQVAKVRQAAYEALLWLAESSMHHDQEHPSGRKISPEAAARQALIYLARAETAHRPTFAFFAVRATCHKRLKDEPSARADAELARRTRPTLAFDHTLTGLAAYDDRDLVKSVKAFEAALRLEPAHYWSMIRLGACWCDLGRGPEDYTTAVAAFTGCILQRPDYAHAYYCRANALEHLGRYEEVVADSSRAIELNPQFAPSWANRGMAYIKLGQPDKALADCSRSIELHPRGSHGWNIRGIAFYRLGQTDKALADFNQAVKLDPANAIIWTNRGVTHLRLNQPDLALADYAEAIKRDPSYILAWINRASAYLDLGQPAKAIADASQAIELSPDFAMGWYNRGLGYLGLDRPDQAVADFSRAIELEPGYAPSWGSRGLAYQKLRQLDKSLADFARHLELDSKDPKVWNGRGTTYLALNQLDKALADFAKAIEVNPKYAKAWGNQAVVYLQMGRRDKAVVSCTRAIELAPHLANLWTIRGVAFAGLSQGDKAIADFSKAIELEPKMPLRWFNRGFTYGNQGQHARAISDYSKVIELQPKHAEAWGNRGMSHFDLGQPAQAAADFARFLDLAPNHPRAAQMCLLRARSYNQLGRFAPALADFQKALPRLPNDAGAHNEAAWLLATCPDLKLRDPRRAVELARKAVQLAPHEGNYWNTLGAAHYRAGDWQPAIDALNKSRELRHGGDALDWVYLAMAYRKLNHPEEARQWYDRAVQWLDANQQVLAKAPQQAEELHRVCSEAAQVLELKK
jgi:tetratricopeptide (TPR) repeat protein